uniref:Diterpene synthase n=1 Tax=Taiwania cryptomerioides TaxID=50187 RepID=A0A1D5AJE4_TAICR|nr:diterpene synthase [Taiwania cryptomerioides]
MASFAHSRLLDPVLPQKRGKILPCASEIVLKQTASLAFTRYCCRKNGVRLTITKTAARESVEVAQNAIQINLHPITDQVEIRERPNVELGEEATEMKRCVEIIRSMFRSQEDGEISVSPYDTAWVARVPAFDGSGEPQFPSCLRWIIDNQLTDGSWGESHHFHVRDRILNTLGCVIALKTWNVATGGVNRGLRFLQTYFSKLNTDDDVYSPIGFEIVFPALMEDAKVMNLDLPYDNDLLQQIYDEKALKLKRIPIDVLHKNPSTLLHSIEELRDLVDWGKLLKLQANDGSFLFSPAATACALIQTNDNNCARYLERIIEKHYGGVPNVYPVDLFEHLWMVDRLERLGIGRYFQKEITDNLEYVYRHWTNQGIGWARNSSVQDVDDTSMAFRLLRLHGFDVSIEAFSHFKKDDQFICFQGQANQAVTGMYNLYRASQVLFPGESILQEAKIFTRKFLEDKKARNQINDKWIISKGLVGEVEYALNFPWYASQSRIETRMYIQQYGTDDIWIGKSLYRMPFVNNKTYIDLARADFNLCQSVHRKELDAITRWSREYRFEELGLVQNSIEKLYFLPAITLFEPDMAASRLAWAHSSILMAAARNLFSRWHSSPHNKRHFVDAFARGDVTSVQKDIPESATRLLTCMFRMIKLLSVDGGIAQGRDISGVLRNAWQTWLAKEAERYDSTDMEEEEDERNVGPETEIIVLSASFLGGEVISSDAICQPDFTRTMKLTRRVCSLLRAATSCKVLTHISYSQDKDFIPSSLTYEDISYQEKWGCDLQASLTVEQDKVKYLKNKADEAMRELVLAVHGGDSKVPSVVKRLCLNVTKSFYYAAHCNNKEMADHVDMVLFHPLD